VAEFFSGKEHLFQVRTGMWKLVPAPNLDTKICSPVREKDIWLAIPPAVVVQGGA